LCSIHFPCDFDIGKVVVVVVVVVVVEALKQGPLCPRLRDIKPSDPSKNEHK